MVVEGYPMTNEITEPCVAQLRKALNRLGFRFGVRPAVCRTAIEIDSVVSGQRFLLDFCPGSEVAVLEVDAAREMALVWLGELPYGSVLLLGQDEHFLFRQTVNWGRLADLLDYTVARALEDLTPREVVEARRRGLQVVRQGDIWFVPAIEERDVSLYGTRHAAEKSLRLPGGTPLADGWVTHPEHAPVRLDGPHLVYRNGQGD